MGKKKMSLSWDEYGKAYNEMLGKILHYRDIKEVRFNPGIYALPRGGLVCGVMLSHTLHTPMLLHPCDDCIVVDDIWDTGEAIHAATRYCVPALIATVVRKPCKDGPQVWGIEVEADALVEFPWEV